MYQKQERETAFVMMSYVDGAPAPRLLEEQFSEARRRGPSVILRFHFLTYRDSP
jgi:hypothetical protein